MISQIFSFLIFNIVLEENVATPKHGATVVNGEVKNALLDGDSSNYDMKRGFTWHLIDDDCYHQWDFRRNHDSYCNLNSPCPTVHFSPPH